MSFTVRMMMLLFAASLGGRALQADVIHIPAEFPTIQQGLDASASGDTILIANGEYAEALIAPAHAFWLVGDVPLDTGDFVRPIIDASLTPDTVLRGCLTIPAGSAPVLERLRIRNRNDMTPRGVRGGITFGGETLTCRDCSFDSCYGSLNQSQSAPAAQVSLDHCVFRYFRSTVFLPQSTVHANACRFADMTGIWQLVCWSGSHIEHCEFSNASVTALTNWAGSDLIVEDCLFKGGPTASYVADLVHFSGEFRRNVFTDIRGGIVLKVVTDSAALAVISDNTFFNCRYPAGATGSGVPIDIRADSALQQNHAYVVERNVIAACTLNFWATGIRAQHNGVFTGNRLYDLMWAGNTLWSPAIYVTNFDSAIFRNNLIYGNSYGLINGSPLVVDARWNWWGDATGPRATTNPAGLGDSVGDFVSYVPWLADTNNLAGPRQPVAPLPGPVLLDVYPNPVNASATLKLFVTHPGIYQVDLFNTLGQHVELLWSGAIATEKQLHVDGAALASGIYFVRVWQPIENRPVALEKVIVMK